ncbi:MAG: sigma-70 family RNA polymerase sigma factor, partial [Acidimicrobiia bacterium]|nr:sigma-70 family RNA polymerase sigma factor [Acidimicrobiia bacterium]
APTFRGDTRSLRAWLYRSVRFSCLDELRRRKRRPEQPTDALPERGVRDPDLGGDPELQEALLRLNERHRSILVLRHVIGCSIDDIAHILGTSRTAVYAASARAERRLQRELSVESRRYPASQSEEADRQSGDGQ